jgi:hypothetical protein
MPPVHRGIRTSALVGVAVALAVPAPGARAGGTAQACAPGGPPVTVDGTVAGAEARTYLDVPFEVGEGTTRVEVTYDWVDVDLPEGGVEAVVDLGLWDGDGEGIGAPESFRGWSGSRGGRVAAGQEAVFVQPDVASRGYLPDPIEPGTWYVDLGFAAIDPAASVAWTVTVTCTDPEVGPAFVADPVDPDHVAAAEPGWYHGDFHMHGYHSNAEAPEWQAEVDEAAAAGLDFLPITDYVTSQHWRELGAVQEANPGVLLIPGREIITYFGHAAAIGETPSVLDYRHGAPGVDLGAIQAATVADGALFQVNHPTTFPEAEFPGICRGCELTVDDAIDWDQVDTYEVLNVVPSPFTLTALAEWQQLLAEGHRITAVSGSDSKGVEDDPARRWGSSATAVFAEELSRDAIFAAVRAGRAYIRSFGVAGSPELDFTAVAGDATGIIGDSLDVDSAELTAVVRGGAGQTLLVTRDGRPAFEPVPITSDDFTHTWTADRDPASGPLGTSWRVDVATAENPDVLSVISNPIFLGPVEEEPAPTTATTAGGDAAGRTPEGPGDDGDDDEGSGSGGLLVAAAVVAVVASVAVVALRQRRRRDLP